MSQQNTGSVTLVELEEASYRQYRKHLVRDYAQDKVTAGVWSSVEAKSKAAEEVDGLLPDGPATPDHFLYVARDESAEVGNVWFALRDSGRSIWIYDILVHEQFRRRGYASRILQLVEDRAGELGAGRVELHVFGHNRAARALYEKLGYRATSIVMAKALGEENARS